MRRGAGEGRSGILEGGALAFRLGRVPDGVVIDFEQVSERVFETVAAAVARVAVAPAVRLVARRLDRRDPAFERLRARRAIGDMADAGRVMRGQLERTIFIVVPGPEISARLVPARKLQAVDPGEEVEAPVELVGEEFGMPEMSDVAHALHGLSSRALRCGALSIGARDATNAGAGQIKRDCEAISFGYSVGRKHAPPYAATEKARPSGSVAALGQGAARAVQAGGSGCIAVVETRRQERGMRYSPAIPAPSAEPVDPRRCVAVVARRAKRSGDGVIARRRSPPGACR